MSFSREKVENKKDNILGSDPTEILILSQQVLCRGCEGGRNVCVEKQASVVSREPRK